MANTCSEQGSGQRFIFSSSGPIYIEQLKKISKWATDNKVRFNDQKSKVMLMTCRKRKERKDLEVYLNNKLLQKDKTMKYLVIIIDHKLTFREHIA